MKTRGKTGLLAGILLIMLALTIAWLLDRRTPQDPDSPGPAAAGPTSAVQTPPETPPDTRASTRTRQPLHLTPVVVTEDSGEPAGSFSGRVLCWTTGAGVPGAELTFARLQATFSCLTNAQGEFHFRVPEPATYELAAVVAEGYLPFAPAWGHSPVVLVSQPGKRIEDVVVYLRPSVDYQGRVVDPDRRPVAGAEVEMLVDADRRSSLMPLKNRFTTDQQGAFKFNAPDNALMIARHPDFGPAYGRVDRSVQVSHRLTLELSQKPDRPVEAHSISGRVLDPQGAALPDAWVTARRTRGSVFDPQGRESWWSTATDTDGRFVLEGLEAQGYDLKASYRDLIPARVGAVQAPASGVVLSLTSRGGGISGTVRAAASGQVVPEFTVQVSVHSGHFSVTRIRQQLSVINAGGRYRVSGLEPADYLVRVVAHGFAPSPALAVKVEAPPASEARADFHLTAGGTAFGLVYDADTRQPVEKARVSTEGTFGSGSTVVPMVASVSTDNRGHFELRGLAPGMHAATTMAFGYHGRISPAFQVREGQRVGPLEFALTPLKEDEEPKLELAGIGAVLSVQDDALVIGRVIEGGGAQEAGLVPGDAILKIEGQPATELGFQGAILKIRGPEGTRVLLTIRRAGGQVLDLQVYRRRIRG